MVRQGVPIGEAAAASGLTIKTIRYYEDIGLIRRVPRTKGEARTGGHRIYTDADVGRLRFIHHARLFGLRLADIRQLLALADAGCPSQRPEYREILGRHLREIDERIRHLRGLREAIKALLPPERSTNRAACSLGSCTCMQSSVAPLSPDRDECEGGNHV